MRGMLILLRIWPSCLANGYRLLFQMVKLEIEEIGFILLEMI